MKKNIISKNGLYVLIFIISICLFSAFIWRTSKKQMVSVERGSIDLSEKDLDRDGIFLLNGEWEFYDGLTEDYESHEKNYLNVPGKWNDVKGSGEGYGTYKCVVKVSDVDKIYGIKMPIISSAYRLYINGELIYSNGILGDTEEGYRGYWATKTLGFEVENPEIEIIVQVANFSHIKGGMVWGNVRFGTNQNITRSRNIAIGTTFLIFGFLISISIIHLVAWLCRRKNTASLYFGIFCIVMAARIMITGDTLWTSILFQIPIGIHAKLEYLTVTLGPLFFALYLGNYNNGFFFRGIVFKSVKIFAVAYSILIVISPLRIYSRFLIPMEFIVFVYLIVELRISFKRYLQNIKGESVAFFSLIFFWFSIINDMLYVSSIMNRHYMFMGTLVLVLGNTIKISIQVAKMDEEIECLAHELDQKVKIRTIELEQANEKLYNLAIKDHLTSLFNKKYLKKKVREDHEKIARGIIEEYSVMYLDLDNFKYFNDICGHAVGDLIIKEFASVLMNTVKFDGQVFRVGGDEFVVLMPQISIRDAEEVAERITGKIADNSFVRKSIEVYYSDCSFLDENQRITCSLGIASECGNIDINELIHTADHLMLEGKRSGKNKYVSKNTSKL